MVAFQALKLIVTSSSWDLQGTKSLRGQRLKLSEYFLNIDGYNKLKLKSVIYFSNLQNMPELLFNFRIITSGRLLH